MLSAHQGSDNKVLLFEPPVFFLLWFSQLLVVDHWICTHTVVWQHVGWANHGQ